jgi:hypothetical protein
MSFTAAIGSSPMARITKAEMIAANKSEMSGTRTTSAHLGITSISKALFDRVYHELAFRMG